jgi:glycosyltransferase involved in cell wall biosynthesis
VEPADTAQLDGVEKLGSGMNSSRAIRVCAFSYYFPPHFSGAGLQTLTLAKELSKRGIHYFFVTVDNTGLPRIDKYQGFDIYRIPDGPKKHGELTLWWNLYRTLKPLRNQFDIIHASGATYRNSGVGIVGKALGKKSLTIVSMARNDLYYVGRSRIGKIQSYLLSHVDRYVSLSRQITDEIKSLPLDKAKAVEIPQGVNTTRFRPPDARERTQLRGKLMLPERPIALYAGVFDTRKNVEWLVDSWLRHRSEFEGWCLLLVGPTSRDPRDKYLRERLTARVGREGMERNILFADFSPQLEDYYRAADIFILPSQNEGLPNVVLEAMACGLPCVVTRISGTDDLINHGDSGMLFDVSDDRSFINAITPLVASQDLRRSMGNAATAEIQARFSSEKSADRYLNLYQTMLQDR